MNDTELTPDELTDLVEVLGGGRGVERRRGPQHASRPGCSSRSRALSSKPTARELTDDELAAAKTALTDGLPGFADLSESTQDTLVHAQATLAVVNALDDGAAFVQLATSNADIYVDPRFGQFDPTFGVVPLAIAPAALDAPAAG